MCEILETKSGKSGHGGKTRVSLEMVTEPKIRLISFPTQRAISGYPCGYFSDAMSRGFQGGPRKRIFVGSLSMVWALQLPSVPFIHHFRLGFPSNSTSQMLRGSINQSKSIKGFDNWRVSKNGWLFGWFTMEKSI